MTSLEWVLNALATTPSHEKELRASMIDLDVQRPKKVQTEANALRKPLRWVRLGTWEASEPRR